MHNNRRKPLSQRSNSKIQLKCGYLGIDKQPKLKEFRKLPKQEEIFSNPNTNSKIQLKCGILGIAKNTATKENSRSF
jgi:hypothetical protein